MPGSGLHRKHEPTSPITCPVMQLPSFEIKGAVSVQKLERN